MIELQKIVANIVGICKQWNMTYHHPVKIKHGDKFYDMKETVSYTEVGGEMCFVLETDSEDKESVTTSRYIDKDSLVSEIKEWRDKIRKGISSIPLSGKERSNATLEYEILGKVILLLEANFINKYESIYRSKTE